MPTNLQTTISLISSGSYNNIRTPPLGQSTLNFQPDNVDLLRYRLGAVYNSSGQIVSFFSPDPEQVAYRIDGTIDSDPEYTSNPGQTVGPGQTGFSVSYLDFRKTEFTLRPLLEVPGGLFSTPPEASKTYNQLPTINNWINSFNPAILSPQDNPDNIINPVYGQNHFDYTFDFQIAVDDRYKNLINSPPNMKGASVEVNYNYYNQTYENVVNYESYVSSSAQRNSFQVDETNVASYYALSSVIGKTNQGSRDARNIATLGGRFVPFKTDATTQKYNLKEIDYFSEYAKTLYAIRNSAESTAESYLEYISDKQKNLIFPGDQLTSLFQDGVQILSDLPMYNKISFDMDSSPSPHVKIQDFVDKLTDENMWARFIGASMFLPSYEGDRGFFNIYAKDGLPFTDDNLYEGVNVAEFLKNSPVINDITQNINLSEIFTPGDTDTDSSSNLLNNLGDLPPLTQLAFTEVFRLPYQQLNNEMRTYEEILNGAKAPSRIMFYEVQKWSVDAGNNPVERIQSYFVPNTGNNDRANLYDTQIRYGKSYIYRIYSHVLVVGNSYRYQLDEITSPEQYSDGNNLTAKMCVFNNPNIRLIRVPYYQKLIVVSDKPPISPDVSIYPYFGSQNKLKFLLQGANGEVRQMPVIINPGDQTIFDNVRKALNLGPTETIPFKSDDPSVKFDIFRLDRRPAAYSDFKFGDYQQITYAPFVNPYKKASSAAFDDSIEPNKKYYYTFRSVDVHGKVSNPSPIYEIEISYDGASAFLLTKVISLVPEKNPPQAATKKLRKYIRIKPNFEQTLLNERQSGIITPDGAFDSDWFPKTENERQNHNKEIILGRDESSLWNKTFKVRLISKKSGKKIDLNINFKTNKVIIDEKDVNNIS